VRANNAGNHEKTRQGIVLYGTKGAVGQQLPLDPLKEQLCFVLIYSELKSGFVTVDSRGGSSEGV
jgi:hypothetical protein